MIPPISSRLARTLLIPFLVTPVLPAQELWVSGFTSDRVHRYDFATGATLGAIQNVNGAQGVVHGPDGNLYVAAEVSDRILQLDPVTLQLLDNFVWDDPATPFDDTGGLNGPTGLVFGPDGNLYVASFDNDRVLRYDGATGTFLDTFVTPGSGLLNGPDAGIVFGPDGHFYVPSYWNNRILRYDGKTGAFLDTFIGAGVGGLSNPRTLVFRSDGTLFVSSEGTNGILQYSSTGAFLGRRITTPAPTGFVIAPQDGNLYVTSAQTEDVRIFDGLTYASLGTLVTSGQGGLVDAVYLTLHPDPFLRLGRLSPGIAGQHNTLSLTNATPHTRQILVVGSIPGSIRLGGCPAAYLGIADPLLFPVRSDAQGRVDLGADLLPELSGASFAFQFVELASCRVSNLVLQTLD